MKEEAQLTFRPSVNQYHDVRAQLNLRHPEAYLAQVTAKRQAQLAQRLEERRSREVLPSRLCLCDVNNATCAVLIATALLLDSTLGGPDTALRSVFAGPFV